MLWNEQNNNGGIDFENRAGSTGGVNLEEGKGEESLF